MLGDTNYMLLQAMSDGAYFSQWFYVVMFFGVAAVAYFLGKKQGKHEMSAAENTSDGLNSVTADDDLEDLRERYRLVFTEAALGMAIVDPGGYTRVTNAYFQKMMGYSGEELNQMTFGEFTHPDDLQKDLDLYQQVLDRKIDHYEMEKRYIHKDGHVIWGYLTVSVIRDKQGNILSALGMVQDITERKELYEKLQTQTEQFGLFIKNVPAGIAMFDNEMKYIAVSDQWYKNYSIEGRQIIGKSHYDVFPQLNDKPDWLEAHQRGLHGEILKKDRDSMINHEGEKIWTRWQIHPWKNNEDQIGGIIIFTEIITDRVKAEVEAKEKQELLQLVIDNMNEGLVVLGPNNHVEVLNLPRSKNLTIPEGTVFNKGYDHLLTGNKLYQKDGVTEIMQEEHPLKKAENGEVFDDYVTNVKIGGGLKSIYFSNSGAPLKDDEGNIKGGVVVFRDVTEQMEWEQKLKQLNVELEEQVKKRTAELEASYREMESFSYSVSHDLRAPLRAITGFSRILSNDYADKLDADGQRYLDVIMSNSNNMGQLIDDLLEFSRLGRKALKLEKLNISEAIRDIWNEQVAMCEDNKAELILHELPAISADRTMLRQVWVNLISNALKFSSHQQKPLIEIGSKEKDGIITFYVKDNGVGFDMKYYNKLFGVFQRLHSSADFEGTGVGLALTHRIITKHQGKIWAESELNKGTTFYFNIPLDHGQSS